MHWCGAHCSVLIGFTCPRLSVLSGCYLVAVAGKQNERFGTVERASERAMHPPVFSGGGGGVRWARGRGSFYFGHRMTGCFGFSACISEGTYAACTGKGHTQVIIYRIRAGSATHNFLGGKRRIDWLGGGLCFCPVSPSGKKQALALLEYERL